MYALYCKPCEGYARLDGGVGKLEGAELFDSLAKLLSAFVENDNIIRHNLDVEIHRIEVDVPRPVPSTVRRVVGVFS